MKLSKIPAQHAPFIEKAVYLPLLLRILTTDRETFAILPVKLNRPYLALMDAVIQAVNDDYANVKRYLSANSLVVKEQSPRNSRKYLLACAGVVEYKTFEAGEMRARTEALQADYIGRGRLLLESDTTYPSYNRT